MSWFRKALNITTISSDSYYTTVDPGVFYEWRFTGIVPEGTVFTKRLPKSEIFSKGMLIVSTQIPIDYLEKKAFGFELNKDLEAAIFLQAGQVQSPVELLQRYQRIKRAFEQGVDTFRRASETRMYFVAGTEPHLYKIYATDQKNVQLQNFGLTKDVLAKFNEVRKMLSKNSMNKNGRSYEMENFRRFENAMTFIQNPNLPVDATKFNLLIKIAEINPQQVSTLTWDQCYLELNADAKITRQIIDNYNSFSWVKASQTIIDNL